MENFVRVSDKELKFEVNSGKETIREITLDSQVQELVLFKVKTTRPTHFYVRPNVGILQPRQSLKVELILNAMNEIPVDITKWSDKFLILVAVLPQELQSVTDLNAKAAWTKVADQNTFSQKVRVSMILKSEKDVKPVNNQQNVATTQAGKVAATASPNPKVEKAKVMTASEALGADPAREKALKAQIADAKKELESLYIDVANREKEVEAILNDEHMKKSKEQENSETPSLANVSMVKIPIEQVVLMFIVSLMVIALMIPDGGDSF
uniref:MSP domain-containing protein n=1 Tax=Timspurckia oligopyrenoides TaxID=708627 RepID=A0A7S0ZHW0_9RHOD|mmetsp:Transcript_5992/g.10648  ORF Transcript_5992/g.10648 Transcript_5992/m.10648 type:complete len:267 (+) Transcript_5992:74-874(+)